MYEKSKYAAFAEKASYGVFAQLGLVLALAFLEW